MKICNEVVGNLLTSNLMKDLNGFSDLSFGNSVLVICLNNNSLKFLSENVKNPFVRFISFNELTNELLKKNFDYLNKKRISDFEAVKIIHSVLKKEFSSNNVMKNLSKSDFFARELYNLFGLFKVNGFECSDLIDLNKSFNISSDDSERFNLVLKVYETYTKLLEENNLVDYKDIVLNCYNFLKTNSDLQNYYKQKYSYIFIESAQNLTTVQLDLIKLLSKDENLFLYGDENAKIQTFMGANAFCPQSELMLENVRNEDIFKRVFFVKGGCLCTEKSDSIKYLLCSDFQSEVEFIAKDIIEGVNNGSKYSDFAILLRDNSLKQSLVDLLAKYEMPVNLALKNDNFQLFKFKMINILNVCSILEKLQIKLFDKDAFSSYKLTSQVDVAFLASQFNSFFRNILADVFENKFIVEKFEKVLEKKSDVFLSDVIFKNDFLFNLEEKNVFSGLMENLNEIYQLFLKNDYVSLSLQVRKLISCDEEIEFNRLFASFLSKVVELCNLSKDILKENISYNSILDLLNVSVEDNVSEIDSVNILTFMNCAGCEFKRVYIPSLVENYFPKKIKSTQFISDFANENISKALRNINSSFDKVILSVKDELKKEENLLYVALNCASEKVFLLSHRFEQKKMVLQSSFFEQYRFSDASNFVSYELEKIADEDNEISFENSEILSEPVINSDEKIILSASSIATFLKCPLKFYYQNLLGLKTETSFEASYGSIVHAVLEILLSKYLKDFSAIKMKELGLALFEVSENKKFASDLGFKEDVIESVLKLNKLNLEEMKSDFMGAVDSLEMKGFFTCKINFAECEKKFKFVLDEMPNITFKGFIDAIYQTDFGDFLVDYKTNKTDKQKLSKVFSDDGVNFIKRGGEFSLNKVKEYEYQMPLYYLACLYSDDLENRENLSKIGYQYVRPNSTNGSTSDFVDITEIEEFKDKIIENIKKYIVDEIFATDEFKAIPDFMTCENCGFSKICSSSALQGDDDE